MTRAQLIVAIRTVLGERMAIPHMAHFSEDARLNEQLCLDSVLVLQLLVHLELEHGLVLPEDAVLQKQLGTVGSLADFLLAERVAPASVALGGGSR
jgi:acyl carrier protein